ncbi:MAG: RNA polymerase sigma-70 factor [Nocardiopsaceae bacterium]|nr:RNA polymerase sigma-70 factor [Nocardiopsaceae bacterium]
MSGADTVGARRESDDELFERYRRLLFAVSYDMLGSVADAEDCVQEAWIRWARDDRADIADPKSYLVRVVTNVTLNRLRAVRTQRESYIGPWLPEPLATTPDVAEEVEQHDTVSFALLVVLETLTPVERAVFVLRDVFGLPHAEIADAVGRSEAAVRQSAHRAREHVRAGRPRFTADRDARHRLTEGFLAACLNGDVDRLKEMLADDVIVLTDGGGRAKAARNPLYGAAKSARFFAAVGRGYADARLEWVDINGAPGFALVDADGSTRTAGLLETDGDRITRVFTMHNPDKLYRLGASGRPATGTRG